ncbi:hypothetical protein [Gaiella sp.]|uniref:hypothetical protein n=1 Tax=Gaiella sp. TaxID=2663207 RepID=UPI003983B2AB
MSTRTAIDRRRCVESIGDDDAIAMTLRLADKEGIFAGISTGATPRLSSAELLEGMPTPLRTRTVGLLGAGATGACPHLWGQ